jgi:presenilin-like A22 family membrane protease
MALLAIYDFIAVFITKHMIAMGNAAASMNLALLVGTVEAEAIPTSQLSAAERKDAPRFRSAFQKNPELLKDLDRRKMVPIVAPRLLGNGDLATPAMVAVSAYKVIGSFTLSLVVVVGATAGLIATFYILSKYRRPLPAIPPLFIGILLSIAVYSLASGIPLL